MQSLTWMMDGCNPILAGAKQRNWDIAWPADVQVTEKDKIEGKSKQEVFVIQG
jgi:hypothetical protein